MKRKLIASSPAQDLAESLRLQIRLRQVTHQVLAAQEADRYHISHELQDEIAQTLLGINVQLLSLKQGARSNARQLKKQIASAQRLVVNSTKSVRQFARKLNSPPPAFGDRPLPVG
jgi:signal transduction histidine kinase